MSGVDIIGMWRNLSSVQCRYYRHVAGLSSVRCRYYRHVAGLSCVRCRYYQRVAELSSVRTEYAAPYTVSHDALPISESV